ncbi:hypothetical protein FACS189419_04590 [Planctomycetales bacterium]|nr:hypothetical protein FACS189419_04590 [Planctomycetales bacterium]
MSCNHSNEIQTGNRDASGHLRYPVYPAGSFRSLFFWYIVTLTIGTCCGALLNISSTFFNIFSERMHLVFALLQLALNVFIIYYWACLLYRSWAIIQDGDEVATTPGRAVGFLFIPFFNCYWAFVSLLGLAKGMNTYCRQRQIHAPVVSETVAIINSCMATVWYVFKIAVDIIKNSRIIENPSAGVVFINLCLSLFALTLLYLLYNQYAHVAEAIQTYKLSQDSSISTTGRGVVL